MFISKHKDAFGAGPVCRVLAGSGWQIAPGTCYAAVRRPPPARAVRDAQILAEIAQMRAEYEEVYGARKTWLELRIAASLGDHHIPVHLARVLGSLDHTNIALVTTAITRANG
jgi:hypothetical protein